LKKKRVHLTHFEVRQGTALRLRLSIADDAIAGVGDELGALLRKIAPGAVETAVITPEPTPRREIVISPQHGHDDEDYHASLRSRLTELFGELCDTALSDALEIANEERARRSYSEGN
jgi:hypothetical protein